MAENEMAGRRTVLRRERVLVLPEDFNEDALKLVPDAAELEVALRELAARGVVMDAWCSLGEYVGATKEKAIEAAAGKPGTSEAVPGAYKAPPASGWAGGAVYEVPPEPLATRRALED